VVIKVYVYVSGWLSWLGCSRVGKRSKQSGILMCWMYMYVKAVWLSMCGEYKGGSWNR